MSASLPSSGRGPHFYGLCGKKRAGRKANPAALAPPWPQSSHGEVRAAGRHSLGVRPAPLLPFPRHSPEQTSMREACAARLRARHSGPQALSRCCCTRRTARSCVLRAAGWQGGGGCRPQCSLSDRTKGRAWLPRVREEGLLVPWEQRTGPREVPAERTTCKDGRAVVSTPDVRQAASGWPFPGWALQPVLAGARLLVRGLESRRARGTDVDGAQTS